MKRKKGFTLIEMLIVVVIIGILSATLLPKLTGYMARTRDLKRQADLRNIAAAIEIYRDTYGNFPFRSVDKNKIHINHNGTYPTLLIMGFANALAPTLQDIIKDIPEDPKKNNVVKIHYHAINNTLDLEMLLHVRGKVGDTRTNKGDMVQPGKYFYSIMQKGGDPYGGAVIIAKVETPELANYVLSKPDTINTSGGSRNNAIWKRMESGPKELFYQIYGYVVPIHSLEELALCSSVEKTKNGMPATYPIKDGEPCTYSSEDQLYYIVKIE